MIELDEEGRYPVVRKNAGDRQLPDHIRKLVLRRDRCQCVFCGSNGRLEVDHIVPWSAGGSDSLDNLRTLCRDCNQYRSNFMVPADDQRRLPNGCECVYCTPALLGESTTSVYCVRCNKKAPGTPLDPNWHPDVNAPRENRDDLDPSEELANHPFSRVARLVARQRAAAPPAPMDDEGSL